MRFSYDEDFIEAAVFVCASGRRKGIPSLQISRFHHAREKLYGILDPDERNTAFFKLHLDWFREWGLETVLTDVLKEFPLLSKELSLLAVRQTRSKTDEGAELYVNPAMASSPAGQRNAIVALRPESFAQEIALQNYLRHEFMHLNDMVDPSFGYSPWLDVPGLSGAQQRLARERYRLLWDITIDGRLAAKGHSPMQTREQHAAAFARGYSFWTEEKQAAVFNSFWGGQTARHSDLLQSIADPRGLRDAHQPAPGAPCPLCDFPTFAWAAEGQLTGEIAARIKTEFPAWRTEFGLCQRCLEAYSALEALSSAVLA